MLTPTGRADIVPFVTAGEGTRDAVILQLRGDVDALSQASYRDAAERLLAESSASQLIVDMSELNSIDSSGLGLLVHLQSLTRERDMAMVLRHVPPRADALLRRTGLNRVFQIDTD